MLSSILLIATLCHANVNSDCEHNVLDEWDAIDQPYQDRQTDCLSAQYETDDTINVKNFECYKMIVDDAQGFTVQSLTTGALLTVFYSAKVH